MGFSDIFDYLSFSVAGSPTHPAQVASVGNNTPLPAGADLFGVGNGFNLNELRQQVGYWRGVGFSPLANSVFSVLAA